MIRSRFRQSVRDTAEDLKRLGFIDKRTQRKFDALCLEPIPPYDGEQIGSVKRKTG